jgi:hypothetical protein
MEEIGFGGDLLTQEEIDAAAYRVEAPKKFKYKYAPVQTQKKPEPKPVVIEAVVDTIEPAAPPPSGKKKSNLVGWIVVGTVAAASLGLGLKIVDDGIEKQRAERNKIEIVK